MKFIKQTLRLLSIALMLSVAVSAVASTPEELIANLKAKAAPDSRTAIWDVKTIMQNGVPTIYGTVSSELLKQAIDNELRQNGIQNFDNRTVVLEHSMPESQRWALVKLSIASLRTAPRHAAEMATQAIMGTPVKVLESAGEWLRVQTPDSYIAYVPQSSVTFCDAQRMSQWKQAKRYIVTTYDSRLTTQPNGNETVTDLVLGNILEFKAKKGKWTQLATPDGRTGWVLTAQIEELGKWSKQEFNPALIEATAKRMMGSSYLWGGTSTKVTDCSGLSKVSYFANGIILQRDASQQALTGLKIKGEDWQVAKLGDLLFFGNSETGRVTHVGIYLRDGKFIHCSGQVKINSLDPSAPDYLYSALSISRIDGQVGTTGITSVAKHPWYF